MPNSQCRKILGQLEIRALRNSAHMRGQGLLEAVIALGIIITGIVAALTLAIASLSAGVAGESRIIAANLAREGVEVVRNIRDSNWIADPPRNWDDGLARLPGDSHVLRWDATAKRQVLARLSTVTGAGRLHRSSDGIMSADANGGDATPFFRGIILDDICADGASSCTGANRVGIRVRSRVAWERRGILPVTPQVEVIADLYKWR